MKSHRASLPANATYQPVCVTLVQVIRTVIFGLLFAAKILAAGPVPATETSICAVTASPEKFTGKMIVLRGRILTPRRLFIEDQCGRVILNYPTNEDVRPKPKFKLVEDENFKLMNDAFGVLVPMAPKQPGTVVVTVEGRFDSVFVERHGRKVQLNPAKIRLPAYEVRLVLHRVLKVEVTPGH